MSWQSCFPSSSQLPRGKLTSSTDSSSRFHPLRHRVNPCQPILQLEDFHLFYAGNENNSINQSKINRVQHGYYFHPKHRKVTESEDPSKSSSLLYVLPSSVAALSSSSSSSGRRLYFLRRPLPPPCSSSSASSDSSNPIPAAISTSTSIEERKEKESGDKVKTGFQSGGVIAIPKGGGGGGKGVSTSSPSPPAPLPGNRIALRIGGGGSNKVAEVKAGTGGRGSGDGGSSTGGVAAPVKVGGIRRLEESDEDEGEEEDEEEEDDEEEESESASSASSSHSSSSASPTAKREQVCCICTSSDFVDPWISSCGHICCGECWVSWLNENKDPQCPECEAHVDLEHLSPVTLCLICNCLPTNAWTSECKHTACMECWRTYLKENPQCPAAGCVAAIDPKLVK